MKITMVFTAIPETRNSIFFGHIISHLHWKGIFGFHGFTAVFSNISSYVNDRNHCFGGMKKRLSGIR